MCNDCAKQTSWWKHVQYSDHMVVRRTGSWSEALRTSLITENDSWWQPFIILPLIETSVLNWDTHFVAPKGDFLPSLVVLLRLTVDRPEAWEMDGSCVPLWTVFILRKSDIWCYSEQLLPWQNKEIFNYFSGFLM